MDPNVSQTAEPVNTVEPLITPASFAPPLAPPALLQTDLLFALLALRQITCEVAPVERPATQISSKMMVLALATPAKALVRLALEPLPQIV